MVDGSLHLKFGGEDIFLFQYWYSNLQKILQRKWLVVVEEGDSDVSFIKTVMLYRRVVSLHFKVFVHKKVGMLMVFYYFYCVSFV